jgi:hypothetical protein
LATVEGKKDLCRPMGWINESKSIELIKGDAPDRHWIGDVEAKANAKQAHP